ncbi:MAG: hypothetical protein R3E66_04845 [bacterium]
MSTSFDDNSESFEFCREEAGEYRLKIIPTVENWGCNRDPDDPNSERGEMLYKFVEKTNAIDARRDCPTFGHHAYGLSEVR